MIPNGRSSSAAGALQHPHDRPQHLRHQLDRPRDERRQRLGAVQRQRLRDELAEHDRQIRDDRERDDEEAQCGSQSPIRSRTTGSPTAPVRMPMAVIPTWTVEITRTGSSISRSAASAPFPPRARSAPRRAVTIEYSPITKKALPADQGQQGEGA